MSFLISFNGQFSPYIHASQDAWNTKVTAVHNLESLNPQEVDHHIPDSDSFRHPPMPQLETYKKHVQSFEKTKKRSYAKDIMSSPVHLVHQNALAQEAIGLMKKFGFRHLPVLGDNQSLVGLLSDREMMEVSVGSTCKELMVPKVLVALQNARVQEIAHIMLQEKINALPIVNDQHEIVGIVTQSDILRFVIGDEKFTEQG